MEKHGRFRTIAEPWRRLGVNVIPISPGTKRPLVKFAYQGPDYTPSVDEDAPPRAGWHLRESPAISDAQHRRWCIRFPFADVGLLIGRSALMVFDVDDRSHRDPFVAALGEPPLWETTTARGCHLFFRWTGEDLGAGGRTYQCPGMPEPKIDHRDSGGFVVAPGSTHKTGREYTFSVGYTELLSAAVRQGADAIGVLPHLDPERERSLRVPQPRPSGRRSGGGTAVPCGAGEAFVDRGTVDATQTVRGEDGGLYSLGQVPPGLGFFAWDREDENPCMRVAVFDGIRFAFDWGRSRGCWRVDTEAPKRRDALEKADDLLDFWEAPRG